MVTTGWPLTSTRGFGDVGCACPPWRTAPWRRDEADGPGIASLLAL